MSDETQSGGVGQQSPFDSSSEYNVRQFQIDQTVAGVSTTKMVKVVAVYDADMNPVDPADTGVVGPTGYVDVQPLVAQVDGAGQATPHGIIHGVPFTRAQGGSGAVICDPQVGDIGAMSCADRDISSVKATRDAATPGSFRRHDPADGVYAGPTLNGAPDQYVRFKAKGFVVLDNQGNRTETGEDGVVTEDKFGNKVTTSSDGMKLEDCNGNVFDLKSGMIEATTTLFKISGGIEIGGGMQVAGNSRLMGTVTGGAGSGVGLTTHTHTQGNDSHNDTEVPTNPPTPGS